MRIDGDELVKEMVKCNFQKATNHRILPCPSLIVFKAQPWWGANR